MLGIVGCTVYPLAHIYVVTRVNDALNLSCELA
jgi:hypothetical protein